MNDVLGTLFFCSGLVTLIQSTFGVRFVNLCDFILIPLQTKRHSKLKNEELLNFQNLLRGKLNGSWSLKWSFPFRISSENVTKSAGNWSSKCDQIHIYWRNPEWKTSFLVQWFCHRCWQFTTFAYILITLRVKLNNFTNWSVVLLLTLNMFNFVKQYFWVHCPPINWLQTEIVFWLFYRSFLSRYPFQIIFAQIFTLVCPWTAIFPEPSGYRT